MKGIRTGSFIATLAGILILASGCSVAEAIPPPTADQAIELNFEAQDNIISGQNIVVTTTPVHTFGGSMLTHDGSGFVTTNIFRPDPGVILTTSGYDFIDARNFDIIELGGGDGLIMSGQEPSSVLESRFLLNRERGVLSNGMLLYIATNTVKVNSNKQYDGQEVRHQDRYATLQTTLQTRYLDTTGTAGINHGRMPVA